MESLRGTRALGSLRSYRPSGFFVLRTPLLPVAAFDTWGRERRPDRLRRNLATLLDSPHVADAFRVASSALTDNLGGWADRRPSRAKRRIQRTLVQYFARMCDRCTPFGLFAGVSVGEIGAQTHLRLTGRVHYRRRSVLDFARVTELVASLLRKDEVRDAVRYKPNDTLAAVKGGWQYMESRAHDGHVRHEMASLEHDAGLSVVLERAAEGATLVELRAAVATALSDVTASEVGEFVNDLIAAQVLRPDLIPAVAGEDPLDQIIECLENALGAVAARPVRRLREALDRLDAHGVGAPSGAYAAVNTVWTGELEQKETDRLLQVDLFKEGEELCLARELVEEVLRSAEPLWRLARPAPDEMHDIKARFQERYESREVPLAEAFDPERGIGAPDPEFKPCLAEVPLLAGLDVGVGVENEVEARQRRRDPANALVDRIMDCSGSRTQPLELDNELLDRLAPAERSDLPGALAVHFDLLASSERAVRQGDYRLFIRGTVGPSGARMISRFCHLDPVLFEAVRGHLRDEEALEPDAIYAEIVHSPEGRLGNIVRRPHFREVELSYAGQSRREGTNRLTIDDLLVRLEEGRFHLRSKRDGRTVRPRLTSAHSFRRSSGMYRFLCALQNDRVPDGFTWNWGSLDRMPFLPRVVRGRTVYAVARWRVGRDRPAYKAIADARDQAARDDRIRRLVEELTLPRWVRLLADGDSRLLLDLENPLCLSVLAEYTATRQQVTLEETLADDIEGCVEGPEGKYRNEIILPFVSTERPSKGDPDRATARQITARAHRQPVRRIFPPGDNWLYFKLYCAHSTADVLLREVVAPLATLHQRQEAKLPWFFIRYADPENHLRVRFRATPETQGALRELAAALVRPFVERGLVCRVTLDTYVREVERYGGALGIELAEKWFHADSEAILRIVELVHVDENLRWKATAMGFDRLLADFGLGFSERERVVAAARDGFGREFDVGPATRRQLARRLRMERTGLVELVTEPLEGPLYAADQTFRQRRARTIDVVRAFRERTATGQLGCSLDHLLRNLIHMQANRILPASARAQELVLHDFLSRTYRSLSAHSPGTATGQPPPP